MYQLHTEKQLKYFDEVIRLHYENGYGEDKISSILPIGHTTVARWIRIFAENNSGTRIMKQRKEHTTKLVVEPEPRQELPDDVKALQAELLKVKEELRKEKLRADAYDTMIDIAEGMFKVPIRKKAGAKR